MLQVGSSSLRNSNVCSWSVDLVESGSEMQIMTYAGERANFRHSFTHCLHWISRVFKG